MKKLYTLIAMAVLCSSANVSAQNCTSPVNNYDLIVVSNITIPPMANPSYMQGYVCNGGVLLDSAICCTRFVNVDSGGVINVGPNSYGMAYVKAGGTFNGNNVSNNWQVYHESGATVTNHTGNAVVCPQITFNNTNCTMGLDVPEVLSATVNANGDQLSFHYSAVLNKPRVEIYDQTGKLIRSENGTAGTVQSVNLSGLAAGIYIWRVFDGDVIVGSNKISVQ